MLSDPLQTFLPRYRLIGRNHTDFSHFCLTQQGHGTGTGILKNAMRYKKMESKLDVRNPMCYPVTMESELSIRKEAVMKNRLEELRKMRGVKQEDLAAALEVSRQTIGSLENGRYNPSILLAFRIARYFDMSIEEIFIYEED